MESEWTKYNLEQIDALRDGATEDEKTLLDEIEKVRAISDPEERAAALFEAYSLYKKAGIRNQNTLGLLIGEYLAVALWKDLRQTETVQADIEKLCGKRDEFINQ